MDRENEFPRGNEGSGLVRRASARCRRDFLSEAVPVFAARLAFEMRFRVPCYILIRVLALITSLRAC